MERVMQSAVVPKCSVIITFISICKFYILIVSPFLFQKILPLERRLIGFMQSRMFLWLTYLNFVIVVMVNFFQSHIFKLNPEYCRKWKEKNKYENILLGRYGFVLPPSQIIPNALETIDGIKAMLQEAKIRKYL